MADYSFREQQNNAEFDRLASTLHQFRTTVDQDIHGSVQQENSILDTLEENFSKLMDGVQSTRQQLSNVMDRQTSLTKLVVGILGGFIILYIIWKLV